MSELVSSNPDDPLPLTAMERHHYERLYPSTLGEVVVTDPRDPFVWMSRQAGSLYEMPSDNGKQVLWLLYRLNGNLPADATDIKWRDERMDGPELFHNLRQSDLVCIDRYQKHLAHLDMLDATKELPVTTPSLEMPSAAQVETIAEVAGSKDNLSAVAIRALIDEHLALIENNRNEPNAS